jgi:hypothetical protein
VLCGRDLSGQNFTGQIPDSISRMRMLSSMYAHSDSFGGIGRTIDGCYHLS